MSLDVGELRATLTLGRDEFDRDVSQAKADFRELGDTAERSGQQARSAFSGVGRGVQQETGQAERSIQRLGQSGQQAGRQFGEGMQSGAASGLRGIAGQASTAGAQAGAGAGEGMASGMAGRLAAAGRVGGPVGAAIMAFAAIGAVVGAKLAENIMAGLEKQALANRTSAKFGWSPEQAAVAGKAAADAYGNAWGKSIDENRQTAGIAIQAGLLDGNATAAQIQPVVEKLSMVSELLGTDIPETARAAGQMVKTGLATDAAQAIDLLTRAQQSGLNVSGDLLDTITEYSTQYRKLGLDGAAALGTISQMVQAGARDTDVAADALKEFSIRVVDGSKLTRGAFEMLGLDVDSTATAFAKGGQSASDMTQTVWTKLQGVRDEVKRNEIGVALFGTQWEDLGAAINGMDLTKAAGQLGTVSGAADATAKQFGGAAAEIEAAKRKLEISAGEVQSKLADAFAPQISEAAQWVSEHIDEITTALTRVAAIAVATTGAIGTIFGVALKGAALTQQGLSRVAEAFLKMVRYALQAASYIPGPMGEMAESSLKVVDSQLRLVEGWKNGADATSEFASKLTEGSWEFAKMGGEIWNTETRTRSATEAFGELGVKVREVPESKQIVIEDNTPETRKKLEDLGIQVQTLPDGTLYIDANDKAATDKIAELVKDETKTITVQVTEARTGSFQVHDRNGNLVSQAPAQDTKVGPPGKSSGGVGSRLNPDGSTTHTKGGKELDPSGKPTGKPATPSTAPPTTVRETSEEREKREKREAAAKKKSDAETAKAEKDAAKARTDLAKAQAGIAAKERAVAMAEQRVRELKPNASASSRMSAENSVITAREALDKARANVTELSAKVSGRPATAGTATAGADGKPVTVIGDGKGGQVNVGTDGKPMQIEPANSAQGDGMRVFVTNMPAGGLGGGLRLSLFSTGGPVSGPGTATSDSIPSLLSDGEFVVNAQQTARFGPLLAAINAGRIQRFAGGGRVSYGLPAGSSGAVTEDWVQALEQAFNVKAATYAGHQEKSGLNKGIDWTGSVPDMQRFAEYLATMPQEVEQVIWENPNTGQKIGIADGKFVGPGTDQPGYYADDWKDHRNHVHTRQSFNIPLPGSTGGETGATTAPEGSREWLGAKLLEAGLSPDQVRGVLAMNKVEGGESDPKSLLGFTEAQAVSLGGQGGAQGHLNAFLKHQWNDKSRRNADGSIPGVDGSGKVTDETAYLDWIQKKIVGQTGVTSDWQGNAQPPASDYAARLASAYAGIAAPTAGTGASTTGTDGTTGTTNTGGAQNVYVVGGRLDGISGGSQYKFSLFADGGSVRGPGSTRSDSIPALLSRDEFVVNAASARPNLPLLEAINRSGGVLRLAGGGPAIPKIEAPKITPKITPQLGGLSLMPGGPIPIPTAQTPSVGGAPTVSLDPLAGLTGGQQSAVPGTGDTVSPQQQAIQRSIQMGGDLAKIGVQALKEILIPSGLQSEQAENVLGLVKSVGQGISSSAEKKRSTSTTNTSPNGQRVSQTTNNFYVSSADEVVRAQRTKEGQDSLGYDGRFA